MTDETPKRPSGIGITITENSQVIVEFDHGDIPEIILSPQGAKKVGSHINAASDRARRETPGETDE